MEFTAGVNDPVDTMTQQSDPDDQSHPKERHQTGEGGEVQEQTQKLQHPQQQGEEAQQQRRRMPNGDDASVGDKSAGNASRKSNASRRSSTSRISAATSRGGTTVKSGATSRKGGGRKKKRRAINKKLQFDWHTQISNALRNGRWITVREQLRWLEFLQKNPQQRQEAIRKQQQEKEEMEKKRQQEMEGERLMKEEEEEPTNQQQEQEVEEKEKQKDGKERQSEQEEGKVQKKQEDNKKGGFWNFMSFGLTSSSGEQKQKPEHDNQSKDPTHEGKDETGADDNDDTKPENPNKNDETNVNPQSKGLVSSDRDNANEDTRNDEKKNETNDEEAAAAGETSSNNNYHGLLTTDEEGRTALHVALTSRKTPTDILLLLIQICPMAAAVANRRDRLPLHFAVVHKHRMEVIAELTNVHPAGLSRLDCKGQSPLSYAMDIAKRDTNLLKAPKTFWMVPPHVPLEDRRDNVQNKNSTNNETETATTENETTADSEVATDTTTNKTFAAAAKPEQPSSPQAIWQAEQIERWSVVHWLLLSLATHPKTSLAVTGKNKPMLVDALIHAAPPSVISLLTGASVLWLSYDKRATAFAGSTLYTCITRHYPLSILQSLTTQCPTNVRHVRDETGMGLVSAQFICGIFQQDTAAAKNNADGTLQEWFLQDVFYERVLQTIETGQLVPAHDKTVGATNENGKQNENGSGSCESRDAFMEWWNKIEWLIAYCSGGVLKTTKDNKDGFNNFGINGDMERAGSSRSLNNKEASVPKIGREHLLHAALKNVDTPPTVIRMLLALYPESIRLRDPSTGALPLHLAAQRLEYVPRNYETIIHDNVKDRVLSIILEADKSAVLQKHDNHWPIHYAIAAGRSYEECQLLFTAASELLDAKGCNYGRSAHEHEVDDDDEADTHEQRQQEQQQSSLFLLRRRDPVTGLYPFMEAAASTARPSVTDWEELLHNKNNQNNQDSETFRWTCVARNRYSYMSWKEMTVKQKIAALQSVFKEADAEHLSTIYQLLRIRPSVLSKLRRKAEEEDEDAPKDIGMVANHYISWVYKSDSQQQDYKFHDEHSKMFQDAITHGMRTALPREFSGWFTKLKYWIRACTPLPMAYPTQKEQDDNVLLHMALANPDTPPPVIRLLLSMYPHSVSLPVFVSRDKESDEDDNPSKPFALLPLHVAAQTPSYPPRQFEVIEQSSLQLVLDAYPTCVRRMCESYSEASKKWVPRLPIHMAIVAGKTWDELEVLVNAEPRSVHVIDEGNRLYPYQLIAVRLTYTPQQRLWFQQTARNKMGDRNWRRLSIAEQARELQRIQKQYRLAIDDTIYHLVRASASLIGTRYEKDKVKTLKEISLLMGSASESLTTSDGTGDIDDEDADNEETVGGETLDAASFYGEQPSNSNATSSDSDQSVGRPSALVRLLSQKSQSQRKSESALDGDASVFSNVDVMSTLSSTIHKDMRRAADNGQLLSGAEGDESIAMTDVETGSADFDVPQPKPGEEQSQSGDDESFVVFQMRKTLRGASGVKLTKRPSVQNSGEELDIPQTSLLPQLDTEPPEPEPAAPAVQPEAATEVTASSVASESLNPPDFSNTSVAPDQSKMKPSDMMLAGNNALESSKLLGSQADSSLFSDDMMLSIKGSEHTRASVEKDEKPPKDDVLLTPGSQLSITSRNLRGVGLLGSLGDSHIDSLALSESTDMDFSDNPSTEQSAYQRLASRGKPNLLETLDDSTHVEDLMLSASSNLDVDYEPEPAPPPAQAPRIESKQRPRVLDRYKPSKQNETGNLLVKPSDDSSDDGLGDLGAHFTRVPTKKSDDAWIFKKPEGPAIKVEVKRDKKAEKKAEPKAAETEVYFNKSTMKWTTRQKDQKPSVTEKSKTDNGTTDAGIFFDRKSMRWQSRTEKEAEEEMSKNELQASFAKIQQNPNGGTKNFVDPTKQKKPNVTATPFLASKIDSTARAAAVANVRKEVKVKKTEFVGDVLTAEEIEQNKAFSKAAHAAVAVNPEDVEAEGAGKYNDAFRSRGALWAKGRDSQTSQDFVAMKDARLVCLTCKEREREVLMIPCRHLTICRKCSVTDEVDVCPVCNREVSDRILLF